MSHQSYDDLLDRAWEQIEYWNGKLPAQLIEADLKANDLTALLKHVADAEVEQSRQEFYHYDVI